MSRCQFFTIPIRGGEVEIEALNRFLAGHCIVEIERQFLPDGANSAWCFCVVYAHSVSSASSPRQGKVDYKEVLNEVEFARFARLRQLRKELAEREGLPAYAIFTNEHLAEMVRRQVTTADALGEIPGVGEGRVEKYGAAFLGCLHEASAGHRPDKPGVTE